MVADDCAAKNMDSSAYEEAFFDGYVQKFNTSSNLFIRHTATISYLINNFKAPSQNGKNRLLVLSCLFVVCPRGATWFPLDRF